MSCLYVMCEFGHSLCHQPACMAAKNTHVHSKKQMTQKNFLLSQTNTVSLCQSQVASSPNLAWLQGIMLIRKFSPSRCTTLEKLLGLGVCFLGLFWFCLGDFFVRNM